MQLPDKDISCHRTGFAKTCRDCVVNHGCQLWTTIQGSDPQTGLPVNRSACADTFMPMLTIENSLMQRQTAAAIESFRNEMVAANERALAAPPPMKLING